MVRARHLVWLLAVAVVAASLAAAQGGKGGARAAAEAAGKAFSEAVAAGDAGKIAALYGDDAQAFPPNAELVSGKAAIQQMWQGVLNSGVKKMELTTTEVQETGDYAYETGKYTIGGEGDQHLDHGKYVVVWKRQGGQWKLHRDIWNSDMPVTPAAAP